jgi:ubiquinone/menaquinone biosynthesis C-methylase UbiE
MSSINEIDKRYSKLAKTSCCLSCGGAINHAKPQNGEICIDLGSGKGNDVVKLAKQVGREGYVYGVDISQGMIDAAKENAKSQCVENVSFIHSHINEFSINDDTADLLISNCTINHAENKSNVWAEVYRVLKRGGRFVVSDIYSTEPVPEVYKNDPVAVSECWAGAVTRDEYLNTLISAGFKDLVILEESEPYTKGKITVSSWTIRGIKPDN